MTRKQRLAYLAGALESGCYVDAKRGRMRVRRQHPGVPEKLSELFGGKTYAEGSGTTWEGSKKVVRSLVSTLAPYLDEEGPLKGLLPLADVDVDE